MQMPEEEAFAVVVKLMQVLIPQKMANYHHNYLHDVLDTIMQCHT